MESSNEFNYQLMFFLAFMSIFVFASPFWSALLFSTLLFFGGKEMSLLPPLMVGLTMFCFVVFFIFGIIFLVMYRKELREEMESC